ncbi:MAG: M1 family metallopeptidase [Vicinamibacterales bacterium]
MRALRLALLIVLLAPGRAGLAARQAPAPQEPAPITAGVAPAPGPYAPGIDVRHYDVEIALAREADTFAGRASIDVAITADGASLPLDFTGLAVTRLLVDGRETPYDYAAGVLRVALPNARAGRHARVTVEYQGTPDDGLILRANVHGQRSAFVDNWPNRTRFWLPSVDHPADKATVRFTVHAPADWRVIANGRLVTEAGPTPPDAIGPAGDRRTWVWEVDEPISSYNMVVGAAAFDVRSVGLAACGRAPASRRPDGCVDVTTWIFPEDADKAVPSFRRAAQMVDHFVETIGDYPFEKLANVQSATRFGGMENASAIFYSERGIASGRSMEGTVAHEIAHQWFGDAVTEADWHHLWLSEGFATYFGHQFFEATDGEDAFRALMEADRQTVLKSEDSNRPLVDPSVTDLFALLNRNSYQKGGWVLHMLRGLLGDEAFFRGIRAYYRANLHQAVLSDALRAAMESASGRDLGWFFAQWLHQPGYPVFEAAERWEPDATGGGGQMIVTLRQVQKAAWPRFRVPLALCWGSGTDRTCRPATSATAEDTFRFAFDARPAGAVAIDPDGWVLKDVAAGGGGR